MKFRELTTKELNANLKSDKLALKESFTNMGKIRAMLLTIDSLAAETKKVLRESKKDSVIYTAINTALWYGINNVSNGNELLKTVKDTQQSIFTYSEGLIDKDSLLVICEAIFANRLEKEIIKTEKAYQKSTDMVKDLQSMQMTAPIYSELLEKAENGQKKLEDKVQSLKSMRK